MVPRSPITAKLLADLLTASGVDRVMAMDLHAGQIQGFFAVPFDHLYASRVLLEAMKDAAAGDTERCVIVSPDAGGVERARYYSRKLGIGLAIVDKRRSKPNEAKVMHIIGDVEDRRAFLVDDMIDTAGTLCGGAALLREHGATSVSAFATHGLFSGPAIERIEGSVLERVYVTNTIPATEPVRACERIEILSVGATLGEAIKRVHGFTSVSSLFT